MTDITESRIAIQHFGWGCLFTLSIGREEYSGLTYLGVACTFEEWRGSN